MAVVFFMTRNSRMGVGVVEGGGWGGDKGDIQNGFGVLCKNSDYCMMLKTIMLAKNSNDDDTVKNNSNNDYAVEKQQ